MVRFARGKEEARAYLVGKKKWSNENFDKVDWKMLDMCLQGKSQGFNIWLSKQCSGFCGTRVQVGYYSGDPDADVACPNCGEREDAAHLCQCPDGDRMKLLQENTDDLEAG